MDEIISTVSSSELMKWAREVSRIIADSEDTDTLESFRKLPIRSALFLYLNYSTATDSARRLLNNNYIELDNSINDIVAIYADNDEQYYDLLSNLHTVAFPVHSEEQLNRALQNNNITDIYFDTEHVLHEYTGTTFLRDLSLIKDFVPDTEYPSNSSVNYWSVS